MTALHGVFPDDYLTGDEMDELNKNRAMDRKIVQIPNKAVDRYSEAKAQELAHEALKNIPFGMVCQALEAHLTARPDAAVVPLAKLAQTLDRHAWNMERGQ